MTNAKQSSGIRSDRRARRAARKKRIVIFCSIFAFLILALASAKPAYRWLKLQRANQFAAQAEQLIKEEKFTEAATKYRTALQLAPLGYRPLSGAARLATRFGRPEAVQIWTEVMRLPQRTIADRQQYASLLLQSERVTVAEKIIQELLLADPDGKTLSLAAQYASKVGEDSKALEFARLALARAPNDDPTRFLLAEILARSSDETQRQEARQTLWLLASKEGPSKKAAVEALARAPELTRAEQERVLAALKELPEQNVVHALLAAELKLKMQPEDAERIFEETVSNRPQAEMADVAELTRWLNLHKQSERVLALLPIERAMAAEPLLLSRLDALANLKRWEEIDALLERPDLSLDESVLESFRARSALGRGSTLDADLHWDRALALASKEPGTLRFVTTFAEQSRATTAALKGYEQLARFPEQAAFAYRGRQRLVEQNDDAVAARASAERLAIVAPDDVNAQAQLTHLNLLLGIDIESNLEKAKALAAKFPARLAFRVTTALGYLRKHDAASALAQFAGPAPIDWSRTPPGWRAVYAAALIANEQDDAARKIIAAIPLDRLNNAERELIAKQ